MYFNLKMYFALWLGQVQSNMVGTHSGQSDLASLTGLIVRLPLISCWSECKDRTRGRCDHQCTLQGIHSRHLELVSTPSQTRTSQVLQHMSLCDGSH